MISFFDIIRPHFLGLRSKMGSARSLREKERVWRNRSTHWREGRIWLSAIIGLFLKYVIFISKSFHLYGASLPPGWVCSPVRVERDSLLRRETGREGGWKDHGGRNPYFFFCYFWNHGPWRSFFFFIFLSQCLRLFVRFLKPWTMDVATHSFSIFFGFDIIPGCPNLEVAIFFD